MVGESVLYSHCTTIRIRIHAETSSTIMTNEHISLEKYTSHTLFSKGLRKGCERVDIGYVWEVSWRRIETARYWSQVPLTIAAFLLHWAGLLNRGPEGPSPLSGAGSHCLELQLEIQLTQAVCGTWLYNYLTYTCFMWASAPNSTIYRRSRWYPDIFDRIHLLFTLVHLLIDSSVKGQYVTFGVFLTLLINTQTWLPVKSTLYHTRKYGLTEIFSLFKKNHLITLVSIKFANERINISLPNLFRFFSFFFLRVEKKIYFI